MDIIRTFQREIDKMNSRGWDKIYVLVDIHDTVFKATYRKEENYEWFPFAKDALREMSDNPRISLILWSSTHEEELAKYLEYFEDNGIHFDMANLNVETANTELSSFDYKTYFNVGIDDKFGFEPEEDWKKIADFFKK
jgi:hypothetical protein